MSSRPEYQESTLHTPVPCAGRPSNHSSTNNYCVQLQLLPQHVSLMTV